MFHSAWYRWSVETMTSDWSAFQMQQLKLGEAAIYAGVEISPGVYSSSLIVARSKLSKAKIPRIELTAIMLMTELAFMVKRAMGSRVKEVIYVSDSMIALSWCSSLEKKLRLFVQNRVSTILRIVEWTLALSEGDPLPLYHVDGEQNIADLLALHHS